MKITKDKNLGNISFYDPQPRKILIQKIKRASVCLVPLRDHELFRRALSSKMFEFINKV